MENFLTPLSFTKRRTPIRAKVKADAERMYAHARYVIVIDSKGKVLESRKNRRIDDNTIDCLAVFAPVFYRGEHFEKSVVLEIGLRRFVPYVEAKYHPNASKRRGPVIRFLKGEARPTRKKVVTPRKERVIISERVPVVALSESAMLELMPEITSGIQACVDEIMHSWTDSPVRQIRGVKFKERTHEFDYEASVVIRIPREAALLCAAAHFAEIDWRVSKNRQLYAIAAGIKRKLQSYTNVKITHRKRLSDGSFEDDFVRESAQMQWVAEKISTRIQRSGYSNMLVGKLLELVGPPESAERNLLDQIWRVYRIKPPVEETDLEKHTTQYLHMQDQLRTQWKLRNYRSIRLEKRKVEHAEKVLQTTGRTAIPHAKNCIMFSVFGSEAAVSEIMARFNAKEEARVYQATPQEDDRDIPWDKDTNRSSRTGTNDEIPF